MKTMYKVIVAMMIMAITTAPMFAGNNVDRKKKPVKKEMVDRRPGKPDRKANRDRGWNHDRHAAAIEDFLQGQSQGFQEEEFRGEGRGHPWREGCQVEPTHQDDDRDLRCQQDFGTRHQGGSEMTMASPTQHHACPWKYNDRRFYRRSLS